MDGGGKCSACKTDTNETDVLSCFECKEVFHALCTAMDNPICNKSFLNTFKRAKKSNFLFLCDTCLTRREQNEASTVTQQISSLTDTVAKLASEFTAFKDAQQNRETQQHRADTDQNNTLNMQQPWSNPESVKKMKSSLQIKSNGVEIDIKKVEEIASSNSIQVSKAIKHDNGDVVIHLPTVQDSEKLSPLLDQDTFAGNEVVKVKSKLPTISILSVTNFTTNEEFIEKVKRQNPVIKEKLQNGAEFKIIFTKKPQDEESGNNKYVQVVARVSNNMREAIRLADDRIYMDLVAHRVVDRFFIKRCNKCQKFGHYERDCSEEVCCGYCHGKHNSDRCRVTVGDFENYKCINCKRNGKDCAGHSAFWYKCPTYLEQQDKLKRIIPYYQKN